MKKLKLPKTDSIQELAEFWDTHDLTDFENELEEVGEPAFERGPQIRVSLQNTELDAVNRIARAKGMSTEQLIRTWVLQKISDPDPRKHKRPA